MLILLEDIQRGKMSFNIKKAMKVKQEDKKHGMNSRAKKELKKRQKGELYISSNNVS